MFNGKVKIIIVIFLVLLITWDAIDTLILASREGTFLYALVIGFFVYLLWLNIILIVLSYSLKKSEIKWQRIIGIIGIFVAVLDLLVNIVAFILYFVR